MRIAATSPVHPDAPIPAPARAGAQSKPLPSAPLGLNPNLHIDPALGIVVTRILNEQGNVTVQYPAAQIIEKYRIYGMQEETPSGDRP